MIAKITSGNSFRGVLDYLMQQKKGSQNQERTLTQEHEQQSKDLQTKTFSERHRLIGGNVTGSNPQELAEEFEIFREQRPEIKKPVHHISLSAAKGERLNDKEWNGIARKYVESARFTRSPYVVIQHIDTEHDHIHLVVSRIDINGKVVSDFKSKTRAEEFAREIEREYGLKPVQSSRERDRATPKRGEIEVFNRTGKLSVKMSLQGHIDFAIKDNPTFTEFISKLERVGVEVIPFRRAGERITGVSFRLNGQLMKGSNLGSAYSWNGLQRRGLSYEKERDLSPLQVIENQELSPARGKTLENQELYFAHNDLINQSNPPPIIGISFNKNVVSKVEELNRIAGVNLKEPAKEKSERHETLTILKEHQSPITREVNKSEIQRDSKEKTKNQSFDRIR